MDEFLRGRPATTARVYRNDLSSLLEFAGGKSLPLADWRTPEAREYARALEARRLSAATRARMLAVARSFFGYYVNEAPVSGWPAPPRNPFADVSGPDVARGKTPLLDRRHVLKLLSAFSPDDPEERRDLLVTLLLFNCSARIAEALAARLEDVAEEKAVRTIRVRRKRDKEDRLILPAYVTRLLDEHIRLWPIERGHLFRSRARNRPDRHLTAAAYRAALKRYAARAGLDPRTIRPHSGRTYWINAGHDSTQDLYLVSRAAGHASVDQTADYLRSTSDLRRHPSLAVDLSLPQWRARRSPK